MKKHHLLFSFAFLICGALGLAFAPAINDYPFGETPAKTIVIKNPMADDANAFFSATTVYFFEVYKIGDVKAVLDVLKKNKDVESCSANNAIGDFTPINLVLKSSKNKAFFIALFKSADLNTIRVNHKEVMATEKM